MEIKFTNDSINDLSGLYRYLCFYAGIEIAEKQITRIENDIGRLGGTPLIGVALWDGFRKMTTKPYVTIYKICEDHVRIVRVFDGRQDWQNFVY
jgi:addiction module RelE/StbE family toxin